MRNNERFCIFVCPYIFDSVEYTCFVTLYLLCFLLQLFFSLPFFVGRGEISYTLFYKYLCIFCKEHYKKHCNKAYYGRYKENLTPFCRVVAHKCVTQCRNKYNAKYAETLQQAVYLCTVFVGRFFENVYNLYIVAHKEADYRKACKEHYVACREVDYHKTCCHTECRYCKQRLSAPFVGKSFVKRSYYAEYVGDYAYC